MTIRHLTHAAWLTEAKERFGPDPDLWAFACPSCGHVSTIRDWKNSGAGEGEFAFSCVGRALGAKAELGTKRGPCNYAGGGLFRLNPVHVVMPDGGTRQTFEFADVPPAPTIQTTPKTQETTP